MCTRTRDQVAARAAALHAQRTFAAGAGEVTDIKEFGHVTGLEKYEMGYKHPPLHVIMCAQV